MKKEPRKPQSDWFRYSTLGLQLVLIVVACALFGNYLDSRSGGEKPIWTAVLSLFGVVCAVVYMIVAVNRITKK